MPAIVYLDSGIWIEQATDDDDAIEQAVQILKKWVEDPYNTEDIALTVEWEDED